MHGFFGKAPKKLRNMVRPCDMRAGRAWHNGPDDIIKNTNSHFQHPSFKAIFVYHREMSALALFCPKWGRKTCFQHLSYTVILISILGYIGDVWKTVKIFLPQIK